MCQSWIFFLKQYLFLKQLNVENVRLEKINMDRRTFIQELKLPVMATCAICLGSCAKDDITTPGGGNTGGNNTGGNTTNSFKVDLTKELQAVGSFIFNDKIIVVRLATGSVPSSFVALQRACTHQGTDVNWNASKNEFICPNHGARFNTSGQNIGGQSTGALPVYAISISGTTLSVG